MRNATPGRSVPGRWLGVIVIAIVIWFSLLSHLGALGFVGPDEPRYAAIAREMAQSGDWVTPRLFGRPWFEKPILYYWAAAASFRWFGVSEFAARFPSALAAVVATLVLGWTALKFYGRESAWACLVIFPTCIGAFAFARAATPDMLFSSALALAMASAAGELEHSGALVACREDTPPTLHPARFGRIAFGLWIGIAVLAKGPAAIILAAGSVGLWALITWRWREALRLSHWTAWVSFAVVALPWYVVCALRNPGFFRTFLLLHNLERYLKPVFQHQQPVWFFGPVLLLGLLPWTAALALLPGEAVRCWKNANWRGSPGLFFACWAIFPVLFFSFSESKLPGYILPAIPPLALLLASSLAKVEARRNRRAEWALVGVGATWFGLAAFGMHWLGQLPRDLFIELTRPVVFCVVLAAGTGVLIAALALARRSLFAVAAAALLTASLVEYAGVGPLPRLDPFLSARSAARAAENSLRPGETIATFQLRRAWSYGMNYYLGMKLPEWSPTFPGPVLVCASEAGIEQLQRSKGIVRVRDVRPNSILLVEVR